MHIELLSLFHPKFDTTLHTKLVISFINRLYTFIQVGC